MEHRNGRMKYPIGYTALLLVSALGCSKSPTVCLGIGGFAITAVVRNASTGSPEAYGATLIVRDGPFADSVTGVYTGASEVNATLLEAALDRPGPYDVTVRKSGFETWSREDIAVDQGECRVEGKVLNVALTPSRD